MHKLFLAVLLAALSNAASAGVVYYVDLAAEAGSHITSFEIATHGSERFHTVPIKVEPQGAVDAVTIAIRRGEGDCLRDLRIGFADGRRIVRRDFDVCKLATVQAGESLMLVAQP